MYQHYGSLICFTTIHECTPAQVGHLSREVWPRLPGTLSHAPMVLLVNRSTASASEVLAGALHDNGRWSLGFRLGFGLGLALRVGDEEAPPIASRL